jgi:hypothetical protein
VVVEIWEYEGSEDDDDGAYDGPITVDKRLPQLLPVTLQHLTLSKGLDLGWTRLGWKVLLRPNSLTHLAALQQLTLNGVELDSKGCQAVAEHLMALQQVRVRGSRYGPQDDPMLLLAPKLVEYSSRGSWAAAAAPQLVHLTRLVWRGGAYEGAAEALAALTGLQQLMLEGDMRGVADVLQQAAGLPQLRSLQLESNNIVSIRSHEDVSASLSRCTQLTSLILAFRKRYGEAYLPVPQQLVGLRCLTVPWELLEQEAGAWLAPLTALTRLCVVMGSGLLPPAEWPAYGTEARQQLGQLHQAMAQQVLQQVQVWPPALQQVVVWMEWRRATEGVAPRSWQHTPAAPGSAPFSVYFEEGDSFGSRRVAEGWARPFSPCPHLPGVRELTREVQGS